MVAAQEQKPAEDPMMKAMMEAGTPGEVHKTMQDMVGTWNVAIKSYMDPAKPTESTGTSTMVSLLDGRYIQETMESTFMGMPFRGIGTFGYDKVLKQYVSTWIDNMSTGIMTSVGSSPDGGKTVNWMGKGSDPVTGKEQSFRSIAHNVDPDHAHFEMYGAGPDGKEMKMMEISYTRKK